MKRISAIAIAAALIGTGAVAAAPHPVAHPKLTKAQAQAIALKAAPGVVKEAEYEKENGAWRYSFDILQGKRIHEIGVDPNTGTIIESSYESAGDKD